MYKAVSFQVKFENGISPSIHSATGVKQGFVMSSLPFNSDGDPAELSDCKINCFLYADDVILLLKPQEDYNFACINYYVSIINGTFMLILQKRKTPIGRWNRRIWGLY